MSDIENYLDQACRNLNGPDELRQNLRQEIREHLEEAIEALVAEGASREAATRQAIEELGEAETMREGMESVYAPSLTALFVDQALNWRGRKRRMVALWTLVITVVVCLLMIPIKGTHLAHLILNRGPIQLLIILVIVRNLVVFGMARQQGRFPDLFLWQYAVWSIFPVLLGKVGTHLGIGMPAHAYLQSLPGAETIEQLKEAGAQTLAGLQTAYDTTLMGQIGTLFSVVCFMVLLHMRMRAPNEGVDLRGQRVSDPSGNMKSPYTSWLSWIIPIVITIAFFLVVKPFNGDLFAYLEKKDVGKAVFILSTFIFVFARNVVAFGVARIQKGFPDFFPWHFLAWSIFLYFLTTGMIDTIGGKVWGLAFGQFLQGAESFAEMKDVAARVATGCALHHDLKWVGLLGTLVSLGCFTALLSMKMKTSNLQSTENSK